MTNSMYKIRIKKGDTVLITSGKYKGQTGKVLATHPTQNKVTVEGINVVKRHVKPTQQKPQGGIVNIQKPIWVSKVAVISGTDKKPARIGYSFDKQGNKIRINSRTGKELK